jgi:hypothetical protein
VLTSSPKTCALPRMGPPPDGLIITTRGLRRQRVFSLLSLHRRNKMLRPLLL